MVKFIHVDNKNDAVPDPDPEMGGGGGGGGKKRVSHGPPPPPKIRVAQGPRPPPLDPPMRRTMTNLKHLIRSFAASARMKPL